MLTLIKKLLGFGPSANFKELHEQGAVILDVRSAAEFNSGHIKGAVNIPLDKLSGNMKKIQGWKKPVITCCLSGTRSGMATGILRKNGVEVYNGGGWSSLRNRLK
jgi:rhodanese-related sulfurtransferase